MSMNAEEVQQESRIDDPDEISLANFEMVSGEFFAQIKEPIFTLNGRKSYVNTSCVRMMPDVDYVQILVSIEEMKLVLLPCDENTITGFKWARIKDGKRVPIQRTGEPFVLLLCDKLGWNPKNRYQILGKKLKAEGKSVMVFDLTSKKVFAKSSSDDNENTDRRTTILSGWDGKFGPKYGEVKRSLEIETFKSFTVFSVKDGETIEGTPLLPAGVNNDDGKRIDT